MRSSEDPIPEFYDLLIIPTWLRPHFETEFENHRETAKGVCFLAIEDPALPPVGCVYCDLTPPHYSYGQQIPIFGWLRGHTPEIISYLLITIENYVKEQGYSHLRGPINFPSILGGWGLHLEGESLEDLIEIPRSTPILKDILTSCGFQCEAKYYMIEYQGDRNLSETFEWVSFEFISWPIPKLLGHPEILKQLQALIQANFSNRLPDTSAENQMETIIRYLAAVDHGEDFYVIVRNKATQEIAGLCVDIPNMFEVWRGKPMTMTNINSLIIAPNYRSKAFSHFIYLPIAAALHKRGIIREIGTYVWSQNIPALRSFGKVCEKISTFGVFQKQIDTNFS